MQSTIKNLIERLAPAGAVLALSLLAASVHAAAPGITGTGGAAATFNLTAQPAFLNQPDGQTVYSWGYGCATAPNTGQFVGVTKNASCSSMQVPGPTMVVTEGTTVTVTLTNNLPNAVGNTSILFPGFQVSAAGGAAGLLTQEAPPGGSVTYTFTASQPGTHSYYSGTQSDLQIEMGLYGAIIVLPNSAPALCGSIGSTSSGLPALNPGGNAQARAHWGEGDFRLATAAYDHPASCYDREYLFQFAEMDPNIHKAALAQVTALSACTAGAAGCSLEVPTEPYHPAYFLINGRSMPDDMDPNYGGEYPHQPYNGNPHMHPGEMVLLRIVGQGRWQHPFHEHANHVRILARDANLILSTASVSYQDGSTNGVSAPGLAGAPLFTTTTTPGQTMDGIFYFTGRGLNWDMFGHNPTSADPLGSLGCKPDANGYNTSAPTAANYYEWCQDHNKPLEKNPFGDVPVGGPATLPNPNIFTNGAWYSGSPYFGPDATLRADTSLRNDGNRTLGAMSGCATGTVNGEITAIAVTTGGSGYAGTLTVSIAGGGGSGAKATASQTGGVITGITITDGGGGYTSQPTVTVSGSAGGTGFSAGTVSIPGVSAPSATPNCSNLQPSNTQANMSNERGWAFMWHSHNEREITTNNVFPGGMFMMMLVDSREFVIDESM